MKFILTLLLLANIACSKQTETKMDEQTIRNYLMENPKIVMEIVNNAVLHNRQEEESKKFVALSGARAKLANANLATIVLGKGDLTFVEFFDYQCGFCKKAHSQVRAALKNDKNIRFVYKEFPILGDVSTFASIAAIASHRQGKYVKFHNALMTTPGRLSKESIFTIAKKIGLDVARLRKDMTDEKINSAIIDNRALAQQLGINGTPSFVLFNGANIKSVVGVKSERELTQLFKNFRAGIN